MKIRGEIELELQCLSYVRELDGELWKIRQVGQRSLNDRLLLLPGLPAVFVEFKDDRGVLSPGQERKLRRLAALGQRVWVIREYRDFRARIAQLRQEVQRAGL